MKLIIVKRNKFDVFDRLSRTFADDPNVKVVWERRFGQPRENPGAVSGAWPQPRRLQKPMGNRDYIVIHTAQRQVDYTRNRSRERPKR